MAFYFYQFQYPHLRNGKLYPKLTGVGKVVTNYYITAVNIISVCV